ncbi:MAG TPA: ATP-grasp domain-containing protein [Nitrosomonas sp.]|nr:ATP-grasp domain-containing protein [Nitrosomonas sp.]
MKKKPVINILFTSAGRRVELLRAFRNAYQALGLSGNIIAVDANPLAPCLNFADRSYLVPSLSSPDYISSIAAICRKEHIKLVFPLIDPDIPLLAEHRESIEITGAEVVVLSKEAVAVTSDKLCTHNFFDRIGVLTPRSWLPIELNPANVPYPLFIKPRHGSAGKDSFKVENAEQLIYFSKYIADPIIEEFLSGPEITNDVLCDLKGKVLAVVSRERIEVRSGEVAKGVTIYNEQIMHSCIRITEALGGKGQITIQCIMNDGIPYFTEINARFGGGTPLGIAAGCDGPQWLLAQAAGISIEIPPMGTYDLGLYVTRFDDSMLLTKNEYEKITRNSLRP